MQQESPVMRSNAFLLLWLVSMASSAQDLAPELARKIAEYEASPTVAVIDRKHLFPDTMVKMAVLSPDGRFVSAGINDGSTTRLVLLDTDTLQETSLLSNDRLRNVEWSGDSGSLLLELADAIGVVSPAAPARASYITRLDRAAGDSYLGPADNEGKHILVARESSRRFLLERIARDGTTEALFDSDTQIDQALSGADGETLYVLLHDVSGLAIHRLQNGQLALIQDCGIPALNACELLAYDASRDVLWLKLHGDADKAGLYEWSESTGTLTRVHEDPLGKVDPEAVAFLDSRPIAIAYEDDTRHWYALDTAQPEPLDFGPNITNSQVTLQAGTNGNWLLREAGSLLRESRYFLRRQDGTLQQILATAGPAPALDPTLLSAKVGFEFTASDGRSIPAYVSLPRGVDIARAPLVALIHGGPWGRVRAGYEPMTQLLTNRGYIVFEPNFRASTGYGRAHVLAANNDFGDGRVQLDITEGVHYLLEHGVGNREKVGIVGGSFGGFAVLSGLAFTPELYRVGVALVPPADLGYTLAYSLAQPSFVRSQPSIRQRLITLGADYEDPAVLQRMYDKSPQAHLDAIKAPLLVSAGADDNRIDIRHVKDYALHLLNESKQLALLIDEDEGHGFLSDEASEMSLYLTEVMLARHLGGRLQTLGDPLLHQYLDERLLLNTVPGFLEGLGHE